MSRNEVWKQQCAGEILHTCTVLRWDDLLLRRILCVLLGMSCRENVYLPTSFR